MKREIQALNRQLRKYGTTCRAFYRGCGRGVPFKAFVADFLHKRGVLSTQSFQEIGNVLGVNAPDAMSIYAEYRDFWETHDDIRILYRDRTFDVIYSSIIRIGDDPVYVMAIMEPTSNLKDDYDKIGGADNA